MRKGLGIRMIGGMTLALIGISVLLAGFSSNFGGNMQKVFCGAYDTVSIAFPGKKSPPPKGCGKESTREYRSIEVKNPERLSLRMTRAIISCWDQYRGYKGETKFCEGWNIKKMEGSMNEEILTKNLIENNLCPGRIQNNKLEKGNGPTCGTKNQIYFKKNSISQGDFIVIEYSTTSSGESRIEVK